MESVEKKLFIHPGKIIGGIILILTIIGMTIGALAFSKVVKMTSPVIEASQDFLHAIQNGEYESAYQQTSLSFKHMADFEAFIIFLGVTPELTEPHLISLPYRAIQNGIGVVSGTILTEDGSETPITLKLIKTADEWRVTMISVDPVDVPRYKED